MLQRVRIQNFKSLKDVTLDLQKVNLFIGPNNSGKSNFLKALELWSKIDLTDYQYNDTIKSKISEEDFFRKSKEIELSFDLKLGRKEATDNGFIAFKTGKYQQYIPEINNSKPLNGIHWTGHNFWFDDSINGFSDRHVTKDGDNIDSFFKSFFKNVEIYKPNPVNIIIPQDLKSVKNLDSDCSNLIGFLFTLSIDDESSFEKIQSDFSKCVIDFTRIKTPPINTDEGGKLSLKFFDKEGKDYWADEVSEGVLYFLALLCIVHQPNPPKLLLLEEPEKGIHPRRIKEVLDFIFQLAEEKDIQVILTTHNERVLDEFADIPEAVFVFDKDEEGATIVKNLQKDIIEPSDKEMEEKGYPKIKFTESLGSHWLTGFIGGVPR